MNLLEVPMPGMDKNHIDVTNFRQHQYDNYLKRFCEVIVEYMSQQNNNYLHVKEIEIVKQIAYRGIYNSQLSEIKIWVNDCSDPTGNTRKLLFAVSVPDLIDGNYYFLNGNHYVPTMYIIDLPIVVKPVSLKLSGLFNSITLYMNDDIAIFTGVNIPLSYFLQLLYEDDPKGLILYGELIAKFKKRHEQHSEENILSYFQSKFHFKGNREETIKFLENFFFDPYTLELYKSCYHMEQPTLAKIIKIAMKKCVEGKTPSFIDLTYKRITFLEVLFRPLFERVAATINKQTWRQCDEIKLNKLTIIKYYLTSPDKKKKKSQKKKKKGLAGNYLYDTNNLYSGILKNKISMVPPGIENPPKEVKSIHPSHFGRICPISISSQKPGTVVSAISDVELDKYGRFLT